MVCEHRNSKYTNSCGPHLAVTSEIFAHLCLCVSYFRWHPASRDHCVWVHVVQQVKCCIWWQPHYLMIYLRQVSKWPQSIINMGRLTPSSVKSKPEFVYPPSFKPCGLLKTLFFTTCLIYCMMWKESNVGQQTGGDRKECNHMQPSSTLSQTRYRVKSYWLIDRLATKYLFIEAFFSVGLTHELYHSQM